MIVKALIIRYTNKFNCRIEWEMYKKIISSLILIAVCFVVTSAAFSGYFSKKAFYDKDKTYGDFSAVSMLKGDTQKPYVYRQLLPYSAGLIEDNLPNNIKEKIKLWITKDRGGVNNNVIYNTYAQAIDSDNPNTIIQYYILYIFSYISLFLSVFVLRQISIELAIDKASATLAPLIFILLIPYLQTQAAFFYDMSELLFMALAVLMTLKKRYFSLIIVVILATLNKESFLAFSLTLAPFLVKDLGLKKAAFLQVLLIVIAATINFIIKMKYANNGGGVVEWHFMQQLNALFSISSYIKYDFVYGVIAPKGYNIFTIIIIVAIVSSSYRFLPEVAKHHLLIALAINLPLFLLFCFPGELRNLSFLFISFNVMLCLSINQYLKLALHKTTET